jgi:sugar O-acyltransferase (sialic acid O-acetyltransferase NeuD family)
MADPKRKPLLIVGNGEIACMAYEYFKYDSAYEPAGFTIGADYITEPSFQGLPVVPLEEATSRFPPSEFEAFVAIGDSRLNRVRAEHYDLMKTQGYRLASFVSSGAHVWRNVEIGENCFIFEANVLQPYVKIGDDVILWSGNHIGHRTMIDDHVFVTSHVVISGFCRIGAYSFLGVNSAVANGVRIAADNFIAMGASVTKDTEPDGFYLGTPAKPRGVSAKVFCGVVGEA